MPKMFSHERSEGRDDYITPPYIPDMLGEFDLDPAAPPEEFRPWQYASHCFTEEDDGLSQPWFGRVWCNPPYGHNVSAWVKKMSEHHNGIMLIFARVCTNYWHDYIWNEASAVTFLRGRLKFYDVHGEQYDNPAGCGSALVAYGNDNIRAIESSDLEGVTINCANS